MRQSNLSDLETRLNYTFQDRALLERAITHRSYTATHNERLEFLGDSVLNCVIGHALYLRERDFNEGQLSRVRANLVCEKTLVVLARKMNLGSFMRLSEGERRTGGADRPAILADALEALFGAVYLDAGFEVAKGVVLHVYDEILRELTPQQLGKDAKTQLQEYLQKKYRQLPHYEIIEEIGPVHNRTFVCACTVHALKTITNGRGKSRRAAEQAAAQAALALIEQQ